MKVKSKLYLNMLLTLVGIVAIGGSSLVGMRFVQGKLSNLTERSTPYQLKTVELQRSIQEHTSNLLKIGTSATQAELAAFRAEGEKTLAEAERAAAELSAIKGETGNGGKLEELSSITRQMVSTNDERLKAEEGALAAYKVMGAKLATGAQRLRELDRSIKKVQTGATGQLSASNAGVKKLTMRLSGVQRLKDLLKDLKMSVIEVAAADGRTELTIAQSHFNAAVRWIQQNDLVRSQGDISKVVTEGLADVVKRTTGPGGLVELRGKILGGEDEAAKKEFREGFVHVQQKIGNLNVAMEDQVEKASEDFIGENVRFDSSLKGTTAAGEILSLNSEIISLGFHIEGRIAMLFGARTMPELTALAAEVQAKLAAVEAAERKVAGLLGAEKRAEELRLIRGVESSFRELRGLLFSQGGVVEKLTRRITVTGQSAALNETLKKLVAQQKELGRKGVTEAQGEQERAVSLVNRVIRSTIAGTTILGAVILVLGMIFSKLMERSISRPIEDLGRLAERFGEGDFSSRMDEARKDEFGKLAAHFNQTAERLGEMTSHVNISSGSLASSAAQLSSTTDGLNRGAREIAAVTRRNAEEADHANRLMAEARQVIDASNESMTTLTRAMGEIAAASSQAQNIIKTINAVAFQTNLLALNAAVEAAHAGAAGEGFAVVAEEVKNLAARAGEAAQGTADLIASIVTKVKAGEGLVAETGAVFGKVTDISGKVGAIVDGIASASAEQAREIDRIRTAAGELDAVAQKNAAEAEELAATAAMFKVEEAGSGRVAPPGFPEAFAPPPPEAPRRRRPIAGNAG